MKNSEENRKIDSPTASDDAPVRNLIVLLFVVITTPVVFLYSFFTGRIRNPFVVVAFLLLILTGFYYISKSDLVNNKDIKTKIIQQTLEELTPEEKEELRNEVSTIRDEIDMEKIPTAFYPLLDVPIDMLNINYLTFMIQSGYIQQNGAGSEFILDSYLHSQHKLLKEKAWEALQQIKTPEADRVMANYEQEITKKNEQMKIKYGGKASKGDVVDDIKFDIKDSLQKLRIKQGL
jgi:Ca2+/Na+ antiporter